MTASLGKVYLVGAGPGDPGLLTLRGAQCLRSADVVVYDYLVNPRVLTHAPSTAEVICLGRHGQGRLIPQAEVNALLVDRARRGLQVVRLKGGDPAIFARGAEEAEHLAEAGVPFEIVPGVTAALAAGSYAGIPVTHRDWASAVALITAQEQEDRFESGLDFAALAAFPGTLVFYMGTTTAPQWSAALLAAGKRPDTPAAIVRRCSWPDQRVIRCTLATVADEIATARMRPPAIVILGEVVRLSQRLDWFSARPLFGQRVLVTRPSEQAHELVERLEQMGAECLVQPAIEISDPPDWAPVDEALRHIDRYDWLVFSSANGVRYLMERLYAQHGDARRLGKTKLAVIGPGTAEALAGYRLIADLQPPEFRAESLAAALAPLAAGSRVLLARASRGREVLAEELVAAGVLVEQVVVYSSTDVTQASDEIVAQLRDGQIDWITVTSSAIARWLAATFGDDLRHTKLVSISPVTSATLRELGCNVAVEARLYTLDGLVEAIVGAAKA